MGTSAQGSPLTLRAWRLVAALALLALTLASAVALAGPAAGPVSLSGAVVLTLGAALVAAACTALVAAPGLVAASSPAAVRRGDGLEVGVESHRAQAPGRPGRPMTRAPGARPLLTA